MYKRVKNIHHYLPLLGILSLAGFGFYYFAYEKVMLVGISIAASISYVVWGVVHHYIHKELNARVFHEYLSVALLGLVILLSIIIWK